MRLHNAKLDALILSRRLLNHLGLRSKKVFAIGFNKCGTTSLDALFRSLGRPSNHGVSWRECDNSLLLRSFDCFSDGIPKDLARLDTKFPGSKFILQVRDLEGWVFSRLAHIERKKNAGPYKTSPTWDTTDEAIRAWILQRNEYHLFVLNYFAEKPQNLLIVNFIRDADAATKVCRFLGYEGERHRPKMNANPSNGSPIGYRKMLETSLAILGVPLVESKYDLYCPSLLKHGDSAQLPPDTSMLPANQ